MDVARFQKAIETELNNLGLQPSDSPSFYIHLMSKIIETPNNSNVGVGVGGGRNVGFGISTGISLGGNKITEHLVIDFVDAKTNTLFW